MEIVEEEKVPLGDTDLHFPVPLASEIVNQSSVVTPLPVVHSLGIPFGESPVALITHVLFRSSVSKVLVLATAQECAFPWPQGRLGAGVSWLGYV